jgi:3-oxoadipate enol-lactonase
MAPAPRPTQQEFQVSGVRLSVAHGGQGMPVVLVHGFPLSHTMWDQQLSRWIARWRVVAPDLRGFGDSQVTAGTVTMEQMADDLAALLDAMKLREPVVLCGLSMGGYVAFQFWRKYAARLRALVLCDTRAVADTPEAVAGRHKMVELVLKSGTGPVAEAMLPKLFAAATLQERPEAVASQRRAMLAAAPEGVAAALRGMAARPDVRAWLPEIALPTLVVVGQHDAISTVDEMRQMAAAIPGAQFAVLAAAGHMTPVEAPEAFNAVVEEFLTRVETSHA